MMNLYYCNAEKKRILFYERFNLTRDEAEQSEAKLDTSQKGDWRSIPETTLNHHQVTPSNITRIKTSQHFKRMVGIFFAQILCCNKGTRIDIG